MFKTNSKSGFSLKAYHGSHMTLLAMDMDQKPVDSFCGFTLGYTNPKGKTNFIQNLLNFKGTGGFSSSKVSPIQLFRWVHFPGSYQQTGILTGDYLYQATPRYLDSNKELLPLDNTKTVSVKMDVGDYKEGNLRVSFTRAFLKSEAFANHYGAKQKLKPSKNLLFDTKQKAGVNKYGKPFTYEDMYVWLGFSARQVINDLLDEALKQNDVTVDMFAYDFDDPVIADKCLSLASTGKLRMILDNASLHTGTKAPEDEFENLFNKKSKNNNSEIFRCRFGRFAHCKIIILKKNNKPVKVLTGSTNFAFTGLYVNANHVLLFENASIAGYYGNVFNACWKNGKAKDFKETTFAKQVQKFSGNKFPHTEINFSPHNADYAEKMIDDITTNVKKAKSVIFSVMEMGETTTGSLIKTLRELHKDDSIYSYGVTDKSGKELSLYKPGKKNGLLINAKAANRELPPPFQNEHSLPGHAIHHKFVVTNFNKKTAKVYCGSSNLALGGEKANGDNLLCIKDDDVATVFAIEAIRLVDHYNYRSIADPAVKKKSMKKEPVKLDKTGKWFNRFYDKNDIRCVERELFV